MQYILIYTVPCWFGILAYASHCVLDISDNNRPVVGYINICPNVSYYCVNEDVCNVMGKMQPLKIRSVHNSEAAMCTYVVKFLKSYIYM